MPAKAGWSTPLLHAKDIARSLAFYQLLGFETIDTRGEGGHLNWARIHCEGGALMFLAEEPGHPAPPSLFLVMYTDDLPGLRRQLLDHGVQVSEIHHPEYMPSGTINFRDPDGNFLEVCHWGRAQQEEWEQRLAGKKASG